MTIIKGVSNLNSENDNHLKIGSKSKADNLNSFGNLIKEKIANTNSLINQADDMMTRFSAGEKISIHEVMIASEKASLAFDMTMEIRNKALEAYNTILRTQV